MDNQYKHSDESLTTKKARELIVGLFKGGTVAKTEIVRRVDETYIDRGGNWLTIFRAPTPRETPS